MRTFESLRQRIFTHRAEAPARQTTERLAWIWLVIGAALLPFTSLVPSLWLAAWLAPIFLLRFARAKRAWVGIPLIALVQAVALGVNWYVGTAPNPFLPASGVGIGLLATLAYLIDRLLAPRLSGLTRTLAFPLALTAIDWLGSSLAGLLTSFLIPSLFAVSGTWDSPGYTQAGLLPLVQIVAVTGMWGLTFLMAWFASVANAVWEQRGNWRAVRSPVLGFAVTLTAVLGFGVVRLASPLPSAPAVRVAAIASREDLFATISDMNPGTLMPGTTAQRAEAGARFTPIADDLLGRSERAARDGARIIAWGETAAPVLEEDVTALVARAATLARQQSIYLQIGVVVFRETDRYPFLENRVLLFDPSGLIVWDYHKARPTPGENIMLAAGPSVVPVVTTPYGRLATVICYDADFPELVRQAGQAGADILLVPSKDWQSVSAQHARMATFRAIEDGFWVVRPVLSGISAIVDPYGRVLAQTDSFSGVEPTATATIVSRSTPTLYVRFGDWFAYLCAAGLVALAALALVRRPAIGAPVPLVKGAAS
jgi:apolipoprotein N-acyltransferase